MINICELPREDNLCKKDILMPGNPGWSLGCVFAVSCFCMKFICLVSFPPSRLLKKPKLGVENIILQKS